MITLADLVTMAKDEGLAPDEVRIMVAVDDDYYSTWNPTATIGRLPVIGEILACIEIFATHDRGDG